ncbi:MAG: Fe-S cluster assembly protein SufD [Halorientalis sp.]
MSTQTHPDALTAETVERLSAERDEPDWLREARLGALAALPDLAYPDVIRTPGRQWTNLEDLDLEAIVEPHDQREQRELVGAEGVDVLPFAEAVDEHEDVVREAFGSVVDHTENRLTALSTALFTTGTVVVVPDGVDATDVTIRTTMTESSLLNYTLVVTGESASVTLLERQDSAPVEGDGPRYYGGVVEVAPGENSHVQYGSLQTFDRETYNYTLKRADTDTYATANFIECNLGSRLTKTEVSTMLNGDGSETQIVGAFFGEDDQHFDLDAKVWHRAENTTADLVTRGVIDDTARSVYEGVQDVGREAWNTSSYQRENTLMLSDDSEADASPKLIINNHDTEASHSATVGQIDREDLFYMTSRGVDERRARNMLVEGFFVPVLEEIAVDELREDFQAGVRDRLWG